MNSKKEVPVFLDSSGHSENVIFRATNKSDGRTWEFVVNNWPDSGHAEGQLVPGQYTVDVFRNYDRSTLGSFEATVSETPSFHREKYWYYGHFRFGK